jgi:hypothetical protein
MNRTRAERRSIRERFRNKTRRMVKSWGWYTRELEERLVHDFEQNRRKCNCPACRNEKYHRPTEKNETIAYE